MSDTESTPTDVPMDTRDEKIIHQLGQLRADTTRLNRLATDAEVPAELAAQLGFLSTSIDDLAFTVAEYIDGDPLPDVCPVCNEPIVRPDGDLEAGESYDVDKLCVAETSSLGVSQSILHFDIEDGEHPDIPQLKFAEEHIEPILAGRKTVTIRIGDPADLPDIDDRVQFCDPTGERFASAIVDDRGYTTVEMAAEMDLEGHRSYQDTDDLCERLREYYPDEEIDPNTRVELVYWGPEEVWE